jgi:ATP-dependent Lhr-like helicase
VFRKYDQGILLLTQAQEEVLSQELESRVCARPSTVCCAKPRAAHTEQLSTRLDRILRDMERDSAI